MKKLSMLLVLLLVIGLSLFAQGGKEAEAAADAPFKVV